MSLLLDYSYVLGFLVIGIGFVVVNTLLPLLISPRSRGARASDPYESGEVPFGNAWVQFDINYYLFALIFLAFDVEAAFLFPVLVVYQEVVGFAAFVEVTLFLALLSFAILYAWKKGLFSWK
ncbi:MAG TPA: NADH-quinone oxidoreductase subunit A [Candidatus Eisenbacteria bacterium]|jgi:NADH-quinone oxidoreductase subunit A|nr:NADH-quinone oxidoreductase subunit A [Candidatus Eisenbacteria bacterium]